MSDQEKMTLMIVDDDPLVRRAVRRAVADEPYRTLDADSASKALALLAEESVHVLISDHNMPGMSGVEFLSLVRQKYPAIVRLMLTSDENAKVFTAALEQGEVRRFIHKPWSDEQLLGAVRAAMGLRVIKSVPREEPAQPARPRLHRSQSIQRFFAKLGIRE